MLRFLASLTICGLIGCIPSAGPPPAPMIETEPASGEASPEPAETAVVPEIPTGVAPEVTETGDAGDVSTTGFESPEAVLAEVQRAAEAGELRAYVDCMTAESQEFIAAMGMRAAAFGGDKITPDRRCEQN